MNAKQLKAAVAYVAKAADLTKNPPVPICRNVLISAGRVHCTNLAVFASHKVTGLDPAINIAVDARELLSLLTTLKDQGIVMQADADTNRLKIVCDGSVFKLSGELADDFPKLPNPDKKIGYLTAGDIATFKLLRPFASRDVLRPAMTAIYMNGHITATDGHRLAYEHSEGMIFDLDRNNEVLFPASATNLFDGLEYLEIYRDDTYYQATNFEKSIAFRWIDARYPDWQNVLPAECTQVYTFDRIELRDMLAKANTAANRTTHMVKFDFDHTAAKCTVSASDLDFDTEYKGTVPVKIELSTAPPFLIGFNAALLIDVLNSLDSPGIHVRLNAANRAAIINNSRLIMPVMLNSEDL